MEILTKDDLHAKFDNLREMDDRWVREMEQAVKEPRLVSFDEAPCLCLKEHRPSPLVCHWHHIIPLSWGGQNTKDNRVSLCPTGHVNVHRHHLNWLRAGHILPRGTGNKFLYNLAVTAWEHRPR